MRESRFLCLAVSRRDGGNCIAGIDIDSGKWIRPINPKTGGAFADQEIIVVDSGTQKHRILTPLDVLNLRLDRCVGNKVQPENWETPPASYEDAYTVLRRFDGRQDSDLLNSYVDGHGPLLHSYSDKIPAGDPLIRQGLSHSLSIIRPQEMHWKVAPNPTYPNRLRVQADFRFDDDPYCLVVTEPIWEARCRRSGPGRHPHSTIAGDASGQVLLTISLAEVPLHGFHYKLAAGVVTLPT
ncbi:MAG: hypothetical protein ABR912_00040 [Terracidiphilus sp.]|jgi:hypothetical protein